MSKKLFEVAFANIRTTLHLHHRWEDVKGHEFLVNFPKHQWLLGIGCNRYRGLNVKNRPGKHAITIIPYFKFVPIFKLVLTITYRYKSEICLRI